MASLISDRLKGFKHLFPLGAESGTAESMGRENNALDLYGNAPTELHFSIANLLQAHWKPTEALVLGVSRFASWNQQAQTAFLQLFKQTELLIPSSRSLAIVPWKLYTVDKSMENLISLEIRENQFNPTWVSKILRELPVWKNGRSLVVLEVGSLESDLARSLSPWCDLTFLVTSDATNIRSRHCQVLQNWSKSGYPLAAAIHVA